MAKKAKKAKAPEAPKRVPRALSPKQMTARLNQRFQDKAAVTMDQEEAGYQHVFPSGLEVLDRHVVGVGGIPWGRVIEIFGKESGGKTTLATKFMAGAQRDGGTVMLLDAEHTFEANWARLHGVDLSKLIWNRPQYMFLDGNDGALARVEAMCDLVMGTKERVLMVVDSVTALKTRAEMEDGLDADEGIAEIARYWSRAMRILVEKLEKAQCTLVLLNQVRASGFSGYGASTNTSGGNAIKFYSSVRLKVWPYAPADANQKWKQIGVEAVKNKVSRPHRKCDLRLHYEEGFLERWNILNHAKDMKLVGKTAQSYKEAVKALGWFDLATQEQHGLTQEEVPNQEEDPGGSEQ